jgi:peptidoglycan/LPS O-acetylase OafA/YrhL
MTVLAKPTPWGNGAVAVDIFMLLSGFLMAYHWELRKDRFRSFSSQTIDFWIRRFFRITPVYWTLLIVAYLFHESLFAMRGQIRQAIPPPWADDAGASLLQIPALDAQLILAHFTFLFGLIPEYVGTNMLPDWSIALEMQFYLAFPVLILAIGRFGAVSFVIGSVAFAEITGSLFGLYLEEGLLGRFPQPSMLLFKINIFAGGMAVAYLCVHKETIARAK